MVVSVGYSACHWCHVMEKETFEDDEAAAFMNAHFLSVKVDREERPDVDQVYMDAVQLMTRRGGWPLNCVALPDGRPIWGGTYFTKANWIAGLNAVLEVWRDDPDKVESYAQQLAAAVGEMDSGLVPVAMSHSSGTRFPSQSVKTSHVSRVPFPLQASAGSCPIWKLSGTPSPSQSSWQASGMPSPSTSVASRQ